MRKRKKTWQPMVKREPIQTRHAKAILLYSLYKRIFQTANEGFGETSASQILGVIWHNTFYVTPPELL